MALDSPLDPAPDPPGPGKAEIDEVYAPLAACIGRSATQTAPGRRRPTGRSAPYVLGVAGPVAVGKSTTARVLGALLQALPSAPVVSVVATDGFLYPNAELARRGLLDRKGFPETYDRARLAALLADVAAGRTGVTVPVYSHQRYDVVPSEEVPVGRPDVLVLEGLHVLARHRPGEGGHHRPTVGDSVHFGVFVDAEPDHIRQWHMARCLALGRGRAGAPDDLHHRQLAAIAAWAWDEINQPNFDRHIAPTRSAADVVLVKGADHRVRRVVPANGTADDPLRVPAAPPIPPGRGPTSPG